MGIYAEDHGYNERGALMNKGQRKSHSITESIINVVVGFGINFTANMLIFPLFGWSINVRQNITLGVIYALISIAQSYVLRRVFDRIMVNGK